MKVTVVGKRHLSGTSRKNGNPFNNSVVYVTCPMSGVDGLSVDSLWLDAVQYPIDSIKVGSVYDVDRDSRGYIVGFSPAAAPAGVR